MIKNVNIQNLVQKFNENKMSHVFLMETNDKKSLLTDILELCKIMNCSEEFQNDCNKCNLCHLIDTDTLPTLKIIYPDGQVIKKEQMEGLKKAFSYKPYLTKYNIYIIEEAEKFNRESANTMLKFIEEPEQYIIGFLITNNKENVIETLKSRCEFVKANYIEPNEPINERIVKLAEDYLYKLEVEKGLSIVYNKSILDENLEKEEIVQFFQAILNIYLAILTEHKKENGFEKLSQIELIKRITLTNEIIERLNYNVNLNLILDYFVLSLEDAS